MKGKLSKSTHVAASQERNTFTIVLARPTGCAILDTLRAEQYVTIHNCTIHMSWQSEHWQLTGGDCQQSRNKSGWKGREDPGGSWSMEVETMLPCKQIHRCMWQSKQLHPTERAGLQPYPCSSSGIPMLFINKMNLPNMFASQTACTNSLQTSCLKQFSYHCSLSICSFVKKIGHLP